MKATTKVVSFGLNFNGQLGYECYDNKNPRSVNAPSDLISLHAGWNCSVAVNSEGTPYFWGTMPSKYDGKAKFLEPSSLPTISIGFKLAHRVLQIAAGRAHMLLLAEDGTAYSFGQGEWGKLGHGGSANEQHPKQLEVQGKVTQIGVGDQHSVLLTDGGHVYTFGQGIYGQLGHGTRKDLDRPKRVEALARAQQTITSIGVGYDQTFAINADGVVYSWGRQGPWLGHAAQPDHIKQPQEIGLLKNKAKITQVAAGKQHTLLLTIDGKVYSMGKNKDGCLGQGKTVKKETANPLPITSLNNYVITQVSAGEKHSVVLASDGSVLTFGSGSNGRLGHGDTKNQDVPRTVQGVFDKACGIAAGFEHTIVLTGELPSPAADEKKTKKSKKSSGSSDLKSSKSSTKSAKLSSKSSKASSPARKAGKGNYSGFNSSSEDSEDEGEEEEEEEEEEKGLKKSKKKSGKKKAVKGKLDPDLEAMLKELGLLEVAPVFIKAGITWTVLLQFKKGDLDELGLDVGPRVAIANYLQTAKNKFKVGESSTIKATIESQDLVFNKKLGEGNFGDVWQGKLRGTTTVAIKTIRSEDKSAFLLEAHIMAQLPAHPNVVTFFGLSSCDEKNELFLVTEFVADGSLDRFLTDNIGKIGTETLIQMTRDMAAGCDHLSTHGIVHRDLAARNLLLEIKRNGEHHVKVCDFGLSRGLIENEYNSQMKNVPVRWTAPEAFKYRKYTTKSDVWSFAVTLWEIFSFGQTPYTGMSPLQVVKALDSGYRLSRPEFCPKRLYDEIICKCLTFDPEARPTFNEIFKKLEELYPNGKISEAELQELRASREQQSVEKLNTTRDMFVVENEDQYDDTETGEYASEYNKSAAGNGEAEVKAKQDKPKKPKKKKKEKEKDGGEDEPKTKTKKKKKTKGDDSSEKAKDKPKKKKKQQQKPAEITAAKPGEYASGFSMELQSQMEDSGHYLVDPPSPTTPPAKTAKAPSNLGMSHAELKNMTEYA